MQIRTMFLLTAMLAAGCAADSTDPSLGTSEAALSSNTHSAFNYFVARGLTKRQSAGIVGNFLQESGMDPTIKQFGGGPGRGIAQWSVGGRWDTSHDDNVAWYANRNGWSRWSLKAQLHFTWYELTHFSYGLRRLRGTKTINGATIAFMDDFEICGTCDASNRETYAHQVFNAYASSNAAVGCYSDTVGTDVPDGACVQSYDGGGWYACDHGDWVDADSALAGCSEIHALE